MAQPNFDQIIKSIEALKDTFEQQQKKSEQDILRAISNEILRLDMNQLARLANRNTRSDNGVLVPLSGVGNLPIADFPMTLSHLNNMDGESTDALVRALGVWVAPGADMEGKKAAIRYYIGIPSQ